MYIYIYNKHIILIIISYNVPTWMCILYIYILWHHIHNVTSVPKHCICFYWKLIFESPSHDRVYVKFLAGISYYLYRIIYTYISYLYMYMYIYIILYIHIYDTYHMYLYIYVISSYSMIMDKVPVGPVGHGARWTHVRAEG